MNPLLFIPSPRDIPAVKKHWTKINYDKFIVKYTPQLEAYTIGRSFFLEHDEYTHFIVMPDDLEVTGEDIDRLLKDMSEIPELSVISGICNIDETRPEVYAIQPLGCDFTLDHPPSGLWYNTENKNYKGIKLDVNGLIMVGHSGFCCEIIPREVLEKVSWVGSSNGGKGNFDWAFSKDCYLFNIPIYADTRVKLWHRRIEQSDRVKKIKNGDGSDGYSMWLKER